jgi:alkylated DNA nucleotide flippase Atl1
MARKKKTWREQLNDNKDLPKVVQLNENGQIHLKAKTMAIPSPLEVDAIMAKVPKGKLTTIDAIRRQVAEENGADIGCQLTCGIFAWIVANAAEEAAAAGEKKITPYWRTLKSNGELNPKYPGGAEAQKARLEAEGHEMLKKRVKWFVVDYQKKLV